MIPADSIIPLQKGFELLKYIKPVLLYVLHLLSSSHGKSLVQFKRSCQYEQLSTVLINIALLVYVGYFFQLLLLFWHAFFLFLILQSELDSKAEYMSCHLAVN